MEAGSRLERRWGERTAEERRAERRAQLIRAAIRVYGQSGFRGATVKSVCDAAGLTERYFYESFANSEDLLGRCFQDVTSKLLSRVRDAAEATDGPPLAKARAALLVYLRQLKEDPPGARVFLVEMSGVSPALDRLVSANLDAFGMLLTDVLRNAPGSDAPCSPLLLRGIVGGGLHIANAWIASDYRAPIDSVAEDALKLYGLVGGAERRSPPGSAAPSFLESAALAGRLTPGA